MNIFKAIGSGYKRSLLTAGANFWTGLKILLFLIFVLSISFGIVYPLWMIADSNPKLYSEIVIYTVLVSVGVYVLYKLIKNIVVHGPKNYFLYKFFPFFGKLFKFIILITLLLLTIYLFNIGVVFGVLSAILFLFVFGLLRFVGKK